MLEFEASYLEIFALDLTIYNAPSYLSAVSSHEILYWR